MSGPFRASLIAVLVSALIIGPFTLVRADGGLGISIREVRVDDTAQVQFLAKVVDENGRPLRLTNNSFAVLVGAQEIPVTNVQTVTDAEVGISAMLLIDTSGSMVGTPLADARAAAAQYIRSLQANDEVSVLAFSNERTVLSDFSSDFASVESQLPNLVAFGDTALYSAVGDAAARIAARPAARPVVIMLSDGADFGISDISREQAIEAAASSDAPFYVIGLGPTIDTAFLQQIADASGGAFFAAPSSDQLTSLFEEIAELLRSEYVVTVDFAGTGLGGETNALVRATVGDRSGEQAITLALPQIPVAPQPRPTDAPRAPVIPQPVQPEPEPVQDEGGTSAGIVILGLLVLAAAGLGVWLLARRWRKRWREEYVFGGVPIYTQRGAPTDSVPMDAPPAVLQMDSGETFQVDGFATIGVDPEATYQIPLTRTEFGNAELRVWFAGQRYVIRDASPRSRMRVNGRPVSWAFLAEGDEIEIRGVKMRFHMTSEVAGTPEG